MKIKNYFIAGLFVILPLYLTSYITIKMFRYVLSLTNFIPKYYYFNEDKGYVYNLILSSISLILSVIAIATVVAIVGMITLNYFGKVSFKFVETVISKIPLSRAIYSTVKQIMELFFSNESTPYKQVVIVDYLRKGSYGLGFLTNESLKLITDNKQEEFATVFIPTSPNPTTGFLVIVKREDIKLINMKIEDAIRLVISGGALKPVDYIED